jgi:hypothetical protein
MIWWLCIFDQEELTLDDIVGRIASSNISTAIQALKYAEDLTKANEAVMLAHVDKFLTACCMQLRLVFTVHLSEGTTDAPRQITEIIRLCKHLLSCILHIFNKNSIAANVSNRVLQEVVSDLISRLLDAKLESLEEGPQISRALNMIVLKVLENSNHNAVFHALLAILSESYSGSGISSTRFSDLVMKCLWKLCKAMPSFVGTMDIPSLLRDIQRFLVAHPPAEWKQAADDTPLRTVKTMLHTLAKAQGPEVLRNLTQVGSNPGESTTGSYLLLMLQKSGHALNDLLPYLPSEADCQRSPGPLTPPARTSTVSQTTTSTEPAQSRRFLGGTGLQSQLPRSSSIAEFTDAEAQSLMDTSSSRDTAPISRPPAARGPSGLSAAVTVVSSISTAERLEKIFGDLARHVSMKQNIADLFEMKKSHPGLDWTDHFSKLSPALQGYVSRGLADLEQETAIKSTDRPVSRSVAGSGLPLPSARTGIPVPSSSASASTASSTANAYMERLRQLQNRNTTAVAAAVPSVDVSDVVTPIAPVVLDPVLHVAAPSVPVSAPV